MAKVFIEETTLTAIGDAIRGKEGTTELVPVTDMATRITDLPSGGGDFTLPVLTGDARYMFTYSTWNWFLEEFGKRIKTKDLTMLDAMFHFNDDISEIPFVINIKDCTSMSNFITNTKLYVCPKIRGTFNWAKFVDMSGFSTNYGSPYIRDMEDLFTPEMFDGFSSLLATSTSAGKSPKPWVFALSYSLRQVPSWWYRQKLNPNSTTFSTNSTIYYNSFNNCYALNEARNIPVWASNATVTSNMFSNTFKNNHRLKSATFEVQPDGTPYTVKWKSQTIDLSTFVGLCTHNQYALNYNSGITADKEVKTIEDYEALKNDPDWFTCAYAYSRYNHDSAVETINSLPDTSAYLATAGGTNTIRFKGESGSKTDGGAINTLTEEEIAVATAKGWTVTLV